MEQFDTQTKSGIERIDRIEALSSERGALTAEFRDLGETFKHAYLDENDSAKLEEIGSRQREILVRLNEIQDEIEKFAAQA